MNERDKEVDGKRMKEIVNNKIYLDKQQWSSE